MKKSVLIGAVLLLSLITTVNAGGKTEANGKTEILNLRMGTGNVTGTYFGFGSVLAHIMRDKTGIPITVLPTSASKANIELIDAGELELAIVQNDVMHYAQYGMELFNGKKITSFSTVAALYSEVCHIVANPAAGIRSVADLRGKTVSVGETGSGTEFNAQEILEVYGISFNDIRKRNLSSAASADALFDNQIDAFFFVAGSPTPVISNLASRKNIIILEVDDAHAAQLIRNHPFYSRLTIPAGSYRGQNSGIHTVAVKATFVVSSKLPEDVVYLLTKSLFDNLVLLDEAHSKGAELSILHAIDGISIPFHAGALRYYSEFGLSPVLFVPRIFPSPVVR